MPGAARSGGHIPASIVLRLVCALAAMLTLTGTRATAQSLRPSGEDLSVTRYIVKGIVQDDEANPVEGVALHIGRQIAYSDSSGRFIVRFAKQGRYAFSIATEAYVANRIYGVVSAPTEVRAESEEYVRDVEIVLRRLPPAQARMYGQ